MNACRLLLLLWLLLFCQSVFAQTVNSSVTIRIDGESYVVSGIVPNDSVKEEVIEKIKTRLGGKVDFGQLTVRREAEFFEPDWQTNLDESLQKIKDWKSGVLIFSNGKNPVDKNYPPLPADIANARFTLTDGQNVSLDDFPNKVVVLFLFATWVAPGQKQAEQLNDFYKTVASRNIEIIGIDIEDDPAEREAFQMLAERLDLQFKLGWMDPKLFPHFVKITKLNGVPQTFIVLNGRLHAVFSGYSDKVAAKLKETIIKTLDENDL